MAQKRQTKTEAKIKDVIRQLLLSQVSRLRTPPSGFADFPQEYAQEILVSAVTSILWLWIRRRCRESPETICDIIERDKVTAPIDILR